jgi:RNA polymerase sigma factor for flagellar operon FliA
MLQTETPHDVEPLTRDLSFGDPCLLTEQGLWLRWTEDKDEDAREQLICLFLPYARVIAATLYGRRIQNDVEFSEYLQLASMGLVEAVDRFDPQRGVQFKTFASKRMQGAILSGLERLTEKNQQIAVRSQLRKERLQAVKTQAREATMSNDTASAGTDPASKRSQQALFDYLAEVGIGLALGVLLDGTGMVHDDSLDRRAAVVSPEVSYFRQQELRELRERIKDLVSRLPSQEQWVIRYHYLQELPFEEVAKAMDVTRSRVSQLHRQALKSLRQHLAERKHCDTVW